MSNKQRATSTSLRARDYGRLVLYHPLRALFTVVIWVLFSLAPLVPGYLMQQLFDRLSGAAPAGWNVWTLLALLLAVQLGQDVLAMVWLYSHVVWEKTMMALVRTNLFGLLLERAGRMNRLGASTVSPGDAVSRLRDDVEGATDLINEWYRLIGHFVFAAAALAVMWRIDPWVTSGVVLPLAGVVAVVHRLRFRLTAAWQQARRDTSRVTAFISELFGAILAVQASGAERPVLAHFRRLNDQRRRSILQHSLINSLIASFNDNIVNLGRALVLLLAAQSIASGDFSVGDFALFVVYLEEFLELPRRIGRLLAARKTAEVSSRRLVELTEGAPPGTLVRPRSLLLQCGAAMAQPLAQVESLAQLKVSGLSYRHPSHDGAPRRGIESINLHLVRGSFTVITGRVGAGKSTLLRVLLGLLPLEAGVITWSGAPVADPARFFTAPRVAYTPQAPRLFSGSLRENILLGLPPDDAAIAAAVHAAVMEDDVAKMPGGLDTAIGLRGVRLSGGQIQRTAAARMFVRNAELLVFDDLSSALDVETEQKLWQRLFARPVRPTCLVVSHRRAALQHADHIIVLKEGRVEDEGALDELLARCDEMKRIWYGNRTGD